MPFRVKEQPKEKNCLCCQHPLIYQDLGNGCYIWRCSNCRYKETLAPLVVDLGSMKNLSNVL